MHDAQVQFAVGDLQCDGAVVQPVGLVVALGRVGLLHQIVRLLEIVFLLLLDLLDLLCDGEQVFGFLVIAFVTVTAYAAPLAEKILAVAERPTHVVADQHHVRGMAGLATSLHISLGEEGPEPMLVGAMGFFNASGCAAVALMAGRTAELIRIVNFQKVWFRVTGESARILVGFFVFEGHGGSGQLDGLANSHVAGFAAVDDVGIRHVDLQNLRGPGFGLDLQSGHLRWSEARHVLGKVGVEFFFALVDGPDQLSELSTQLGALVL